MRPVQHVLLSSLTRILEQGCVAREDQQLLRSVYGASGLTLREADEVYAELLRQTWGDIIEDDALSATEGALLGIIVDALGLPGDCLPRPITLAVAV